MAWWSEPLSLSLEQLRRDYPVETVPATISCAGLRRDELIAVRPIPGEVVWGAEPVSNGVWRGVSLARVLETAGIRPEARHAAFTGLDEIEREGKRFGFGGSIPLSKAMAEETLLAWEMNGAPLPPVHGFPLRVIVPGYIGARSVKWVTNIHLQTTPTANYFQSHAYRMFPPEVDATSVVWEQGVALSDMPLNSVIWSPQDRGQVAAGQGTGERMGLRQWRTDDRTGRGERGRWSQLASRSALQSGRPMELDPVAARAHAPCRKPRSHGPGLGLRGQHPARGSRGHSGTSRVT